MTFDLGINPGVWLTGWNPERSPQLARRLAGIGYSRFMVVLRDPYEFDPTGIRESIQAAGLAVMTNTNQRPDADVSSDDAEVRTRGIARLRRGIELSVELGSDQLTGVLYGVLGHAGRPVPPPVFERTARVLGDLADEAAESGVRLLCEVVNRYETAMLTTAGAAMDFMERSGSENLGVHLDLFHMNIEERDIVAAIAEALPRLGYLEIEQNDRGDLRGGHIPLSEILVGAITAGYRGRFGLEAFTASSIAPDHAAGLAIWRDVFDDTTTIAEDAHALLAAAHAAAVGPAA